MDPRASSAQRAAPRSVEPSPCSNVTAVPRSSSGRFVAFARAIIPGLAGMSGLRYRTFLFYNAMRRSAVGRRLHAARIRGRRFVRPGPVEGRPLVARGRGRDRPGRDQRQGGPQPARASASGERVRTAGRARWACGSRRRGRGLATRRRHASTPMGNGSLRSIRRPDQLSVRKKHAGSVPSRRIRLRNSSTTQCARVSPFAWRCMNGAISSQGRDQRSKRVISHAVEPG